jgi:hypothetical protein
MKMGLVSMAKHTILVIDCDGISYSIGEIMYQKVKNDTLRNTFIGKEWGICSDMLIEHVKHLYK